MLNIQSDPSKLAEYVICPACVGETYLKAEIAQLDGRAACSYCGITSTVIALGELAHWIELALDHHFQRTPLEPTGVEAALHRSKDIPYDWERPGEPVATVIEEIAEIREDLAEHIRQVLEVRNFNFDDEAACIENPFDIEAHYEVQRIDDWLYQSIWDLFNSSIKTENRHFNRRAEGVLHSIFDGLCEHTTEGSDPVIIEVGPGQPIQHLFRARVFQSDEPLKASLCRPEKRMAAPPFDLATEGRMNARGISVFYGATDPRVAIAEVRPPVGSRVVVARFEITRPLRLLDFQRLGNVSVTGSYFDGAYRDRLERAKFLESLSSQIAMPVMPETETVDYLVTQAIADYLSASDELEIGGVIFPSTQLDTVGSNVALFSKSSRVETVQMNSEAEVSVQLRDWEDDELRPTYRVFQTIPATSEESDHDDSSFSGTSAQTMPPSRHDQDSRTPSLRLDVETMTVHHVDRIEVSTTEFSVAWFVVSSQPPPESLPIPPISEDQL